ncbi:MAG: hypothetical protein WEB79_00185, partial [Thermoleophilaceae bacterium]
INVGPGNNKLLGCKTVTIADANPRGHYDLASSPEAGRVRVRGWAFDPNAKTTALDVHVYIGGKAGSGGVALGSRKANKHRPDVGKAFPGVGDYHGFDETFTTGRTGSQPLCVYAINVGPGNNKLLGCKTVTIAAVPPPADPPPEPIGPPAQPTPTTGAEPRAACATARAKRARAAKRYRRAKRRAAKTTGPASARARRIVARRRSALKRARKRARKRCTTRLG